MDRLFGRLFAPRARTLRFDVLAVHAAEGFNAEAGLAVCDALERSVPDGFRFLDPGTFVACFRPTLDLRLGAAQGRLVAEFDRTGRLARMPMGNA